MIWIVIIVYLFLQIAETLLKERADVNATDSVGHTPLHRAAMKGNLDAAKLLISYKANLDLRDVSGCTPLYGLL